MAANLLSTLDFSDPTVLVGTGAVTLATILLASYCLKKDQKPKEEPVVEKPDAKKKGSKQQQPAKNYKQSSKAKEKEKVNYNVDHPLWVQSTPAGEPITGFAFDGKNLAALTTDSKAIRLFDPYHPEKLLIKTNYVPSLLAMTSYELVAFISYNDAFQFYKLNPADQANAPFRLKGDLVQEFPKNDSEKHKKDILFLELSRDGWFVVTSTDDTLVKVWSTATGALLGEFNTNQMINRMIRISPDSRFIVVAAFTSDVRLWEVKYKKTREFDSIAKVMDLRGHNSGVNAVCFTGDASRVLTGSKDGVLRVYRINVRYALGEDPVLEKTFKISNSITKMEVTPDGKTLAVIEKRKVQFWDLASAKQVTELDFATIIENCSEIKWFVWSDDGKIFATVMGAVAYLWRSPLSENTKK